MTTAPNSLSPTSALTDEATLEIALDCLIARSSLDLEGGYTLQNLFEILLRAVSRSDRIGHITQRLEGLPSGNGIR